MFEAKKRRIFREVLFTVGRSPRKLFFCPWLWHGVTYRVDVSLDARIQFGGRTRHVVSSYVRGKRIFARILPGLLLVLFSPWIFEPSWKVTVSPPFLFVKLFLPRERDLSLACHLQSSRQWVKDFSDSIQREFYKIIEE